MSKSNNPQDLLVTIVDYDAGNILNAVRAIKHIGFNVTLASQPSEVPNETTILVIPGVGAFGQGMKNLKERQFDSFIDSWVAANKPLVGICLGMQLLFSESEEMGHTKGLGYLSGKMHKIPYQVIGDKKFPVPHVGWSEVKSQSSDFKGQCYFVHSYYAVETRPEEVVGWATYGNIQIPAIVKKNNTLGFQFHPEKSAEYGLSLLKNSMLSLLNV